MTQNRTLSLNLKDKDLQGCKFNFMFLYFMRTVFEAVFFLCHLLRNINNLTLNHNNNVYFT